MTDLLCLVIAGLFFAACGLYVRVCERL